MTIKDNEHIQCLAGILGSKNSMVTKKTQKVLIESAFFNPKSIERSWQLKKTIDIFLKYRNENTPVVLTRQVGREKQTKKFFTLNAIPIEEVDMLSLLIIGNSQTELRDNIFLTKRGYL